MSNDAITISYRGPILTGMAGPIVTQMLEEAVAEVAAQASADLHRFMNATFKHPTPYYETQVSIAARGRDLVVNDRGVVYGPWLEGVSSRNATTRFKGYANWRRARQGLAPKVSRLVEHAVQRTLSRLGGR
jgi:hypothetical protein